mgnify:CR=1 FL=1
MWPILTGNIWNFYHSWGKRDIAGKYTKHESTEKVLEKIIKTYKDRIPDENTVFYMAKEEE